MSIQYTVPEFEPTTSRTKVVSHNHLTRLLHILLTKQVYINTIISLRDYSIPDRRNIYLSINYVQICHERSVTRFGNILKVLGNILNVFVDILNLLYHFFHLVKFSLLQMPKYSTNNLFICSFYSRSDRFYNSLENCQIF